jgi:hypothetical protein
VRTIKPFAAETPIHVTPSLFCDAEPFRTASLCFLVLAIHLCRSQPVCCPETSQSFVPSIIFSLPPTGAGPQVSRSTLAVFLWIFW